MRVANREIGQANREEKPAADDGMHVLHGTYTRNRRCKREADSYLSGRVKKDKEREPKMFRTIVTAITLSLLTLPALAGQAAEELIRGAAADMSDPDSGRDAFRDSIDVPTVARFTLGKHARRVSSEEQARFTAAFEGFLIDTFENHRDAFANADVQVIGSVDRSAKDSIVETRVTPRDGETNTVRWRVIKRDEEWRVVDVEVMGLWLAIEQRAQIASILDRPRATIDDAIAALNS